MAWTAVAWTAVHRTRPAAHWRRLRIPRHSTRSAHRRHFAPAPGRATTRGTRSTVGISWVSVAATVGMHCIMLSSGCQTFFASITLRWESPRVRSLGRSCKCWLVGPIEGRGWSGRTRSWLVMQMKVCMCTLAILFDEGKGCR